MTAIDSPVVVETSAATGLFHTRDESEEAMGEGSILGDMAAYGIVLFAFLGMVWAGLLGWRLRPRLPKRHRLYIIAPNGEVRSVASNDAIAKMLHAIERHQTNQAK